MGHPRVRSIRTLKDLEERKGGFPKRGFLVRFWEHVRKGATPNDCWIWTGTRSRTYGVININGHPVLVHRLSYLIAKGSINPDLMICHNCPGVDNPLCVNPCHLFMGTGADNVRDATRKGRVPRGEKHSSAKLTEMAVMEIRQRYKNGETAATLAKEYGVSASNVAVIVRGEIWRHLLTPEGELVESAHQEFLARLL